MKKRNSYIIAAIITVVLFMIILFMKGITPFNGLFLGSTRLDEEYIPLLYRLHDIFMGKESLFYDFKIGGGSNIFVSLIEYGMFNPLMIITGLFSKGSIPYVLYYVLLIKIILTSCSFMFMIKHIFKNIDDKSSIIYSVMYSLSGYTLLLFSNINYLDIVMLVPLIVTGLFNIIKNKSSLIFIVSLVFSFIFNIYSSIYLVFYILIYSVIYGIIYKNNDFIKNVVKSTIISIFISSFVIVPCFTNGFYIGINSLNNSLEKLLYILPSGLFIILFVKRLLVRDRASLMYLICLCVPSIFIVLKGVLLGNIGINYESGIVLIMLLFIGGLHFINDNKILFKKSLSDNMFYLAYIVLLLCFMYVGYTFRNVVLDSNIGVHIDYGKQVVALLILFILSLLVSYISLNKYSDKKYMFISSIVIIIIFSSYYITFSSISVINNNSKVKLDNDLFKYKDNTSSLGSNYSLINGVSSISYFNNESAYFYERLGFTTDGNNVYSGGTIFSDILVGNKYILSYDEIDSSMYNLVKKENDIYYYELKYDINYGVTYDNISNCKYSYSLDYQNCLYKQLFDKEDNLFNIVSPRVELKNVSVDNDNFLYSNSGDGKIKFSIHVDDLSMVYLNMEASYGAVYGIKVNDKTIKNPIFTNRHNGRYPASNQNILYLGEYENTDLEITMGLEFVEIEKFYVGTVSNSKVLDLINNDGLDVNYNDNTLNISGTSTHKNIMIPINYDKNITIYNNGNRVNIRKVFNNFIGVSLEESNDIVVKYKDSSVLIGILLSIIGLVNLVVSKKKDNMI